MKGKICLVLSGVLMFGAITLGNMGTKAHAYVSSSQSRNAYTNKWLYKLTIDDGEAYAGTYSNTGCDTKDTWVKLVSTKGQVLEATGSDGENGNSRLKATVGPMYGTKFRSEHGWYWYSDDNDSTDWYYHYID